jgi:hypothetical protein
MMPVFNEVNRWALSIFIETMAEADWGRLMSTIER